jgi:formate dehydrogenase major subunit
VTSHAAEREFKIKYTTEGTTICPYCAVGCGMIAHWRDEDGRRRLVNLEGDADHPINGGALCSKGSSLFQVHANDLRLSKVLYRAPRSDHWEEKDWDWAIGRMTEKIKATRDASFQTDVDGVIVNRTPAIAGLGGAALDNEECYLWTKLGRALGLVYLDHCARL